MHNICNVCGGRNCHMPGCPEAKQTDTKYCCDGCGHAFYNGDAYYEVEGVKLCEDCINDSKRIFDVEEYTYDDYLEEEYERRRHDA